MLLTINALIPRLSAVTIAEITGTEGPGSTHVEIGLEAGLTGRSRSWVNVTGLHTVPKAKLQKHRGRLAATELSRVASTIRLCLDLDDH